MLTQYRSNIAIATERAQLALFAILQLQLFWSQWTAVVSPQNQGRKGYYF